jgi:murein DD-endopeptidase MepM/ murein hydrolase activator NlpD
MKRIFSTLLLLSLLNCALAVSDTTANKNSASAASKDTIPFTLDEDEMMDYSDSLVSFPAYDLYCGWDTVNIHSLKFDVSTLKDSSKNILLYDESSCGYVHPFEGKITSAFGPRKRRYHYGVDIDLETGDCVAAAFDGKVRISKKSKSYGNVIVIRHASGLETYYAHLSRIDVEIGDEVYAGQVIGLGGNTGRSRGSHLHFEVRYKGQPINPAELISFPEHKLLSDTLTISSKTFDYLAAAKKAAATASKGGKRVHVVKKGDTLSAIAKRHGTTTRALCQKNGIKATSTLRLGQKIRF